MSFKTGDERHDFQVKCPYNPSHQMPNSKLFYHISSGCQDKARLEHLYDHCPYNFLHVILKANMDAHLRQCQDLNKNTEEGNLMAEMQKVIKEQQKEQRKAQQQQKQQQQQQQQIVQIPGVIVPDQPKKKKRNRNKKKKEEPKQSNTDGIPVWGESSDDEQIEVNQVCEQFAQQQIQEQKKQDSDDEWDQVQIKQKGRNRRTKEKE